jgi:O-antigen ligase
MRQTDTSLLLGTTRPSTLPKKVIYLLVQARTSPKIVRWALLLFVFTIPFEGLSLGAIPGASTLSRLAGLLFCSTCLLYPKVCFHYPPPALWWFAGHAAVLGLSGCFIPEQFVDRFIVRLLTLIQLLILCWVSSTLLQEEKLLRRTLLTFAIATLLLAIGMLLGLPGFSQIVRGDRMSAGGYNADAFAFIMALGAQALIGFGIDQTPRNTWRRVTFMAMSLLPLTAMVYTGTRGGIIAFVAAVALYVLPYRGSKRKMVAIWGAAIAVVGVVYMVVNTPTILLRLEKTYNTGDMSGRNRIYAASIEMISEKPLLGWQPVVFAYELGGRVGKPDMDPHNLVLYLLVEGGLLSTIPFLVGFGLCVRAAWIARVGSLGLFPLVWSITMLVDSMTITTLLFKPLWLVLIVSLASGAAIAKQNQRKNLMIRTILQPPWVPNRASRATSGRIWQ